MPVCAGSQLSGITYLKGKAGIHRAFLSCPNLVTQSALEDALKAAALTSVHELVVSAGGATVSATNSKDLPAIPSSPPSAGAGPGAPETAAPGGDAEPAGPARLDLATLYTMRGLFRGTARMPIPSNLDSQLYVRLGAAGTAMANLAARMGVETTGITLPLATPAPGATAREVRTKSVVEVSSDLGREAERRFFEEDTASQSAAALSPGEGELRVVDKAFGRQPSELVRGDEAGAQVALNLLGGHFPNLWDVAPQLKGKPVASLKIEFRKNSDPSGTRAMFSPARWVHELYPVDEMLSRELALPLDKISLAQFEGKSGKSPTYRVHAYDAAGKEMLTHEFTVPTVQQPYNGVMPEYENVEVDTGWVRMQSGSAVVLDRRIPTDIEQFWEHYHKITLPRIFRTVMAGYHGELRSEFVPPFDTLKVDIHMSEPNYELGIDKERISSLEALQEDAFYSTENFVNMMGDLLAGRALQYTGRIIPIVHASEDGKDARVRIEFYAKAAGSPQIELRWTDAQGNRHERKRDLWVLNGPMQPRLVAARTHAGESGPQSLTWLLQADYKDDQYDEWIKLEGKDQVERGIFRAEQARGQLTWLDQMHAAGLYRNELAYPHLKRMAFEFELPLPLAAKVDSPAPREYASLKIEPPASPRPMIGDYAGRLKRPQLVQWDEPISPRAPTCSPSWRSTPASASTGWAAPTWVRRSGLPT